MNAMARPHSTLTLEQYLEFEKTSDIKHEYVGGELYAFAGASDRHNRIALNIASSLLGATRGGPCQVFASDVKCQVAEDTIYYPDVMVTCDPRDSDPYVKRHPSLVVEVLSPSTWGTDIREKLHAYKQVESLQAYLIASQDNLDIIGYWRDADGVWQREDVVHRGTVTLPFLDVEMKLEDIYEGVF